jgi:hypothetical protein
VLRFPAEGRRHLAFVLGGDADGCFKVGAGKNKFLASVSCVSLMFAFNGDALNPRSHIADVPIVLESNVVSRAHRSRIAYRCAMSVFIMAINSLPQRVKFCLRCVIERHTTLKC